MKTVSRNMQYWPGGIALLLWSFIANGQILSDSLSKGEPLALHAGVGGQVAEVLVNVGDQVEKGQLLLRLSPLTYQARLDATLATQTHSALKLRLLQEDYARQEELYEEGSLSTVELQRLDLTVKLALKELAAAKAAVTVATARLSFTRIVAPVDGQITAVALAGQRVSTDNGLPVLIKMLPR